MHELALCDAIARTATRNADGRPITQVTVRIGHLRQVVPDALRFSWDVIARSEATDSSLSDAQLVIEEVPAVVTCEACGSQTTLSDPILVCGSCGTFDVTLLSGEELLVVSLELADA